MHPSAISRAVHTPMIRFVGSRASLWKDAQHHVGPHPMTPANLETHVAKASEAPAAAASSSSTSSGSDQVLEWSQLPARFRRTPVTEAEMEAVESGGATFIF
ncbi:hypothetical protein BCR43DRAFT_517925 [Syncephalastrum racemosum]|uniref:Ribosomal protein S36, mitochondrial n=1 Tax=Syncephalastrum racemosum TaxID=13706 RepID=A0A1X2H2C6_SYNRA|nr:hypothetical protein BCR43DRAFT_517925 [Syncephalastrum racemosum]